MALHMCTCAAHDSSPETNAAFQHLRGDATMPHADRRDIAARALRCAAPVAATSAPMCREHVCLPWTQYVSSSTAGSVRPPIFPSRCAQVCVSVCEKQKCLSRTPHCHGGKPIMGHAGVSGAPPTIIIDWQLSTLMATFYFPDFSFIFLTELQHFPHGPEA